MVISIILSRRRFILSLLLLYLLLLLFLHRFILLLLSLLYLLLLLLLFHFDFHFPANGCYQRALRLLVEGNDLLSMEEMNSHKSSSLPENSFVRQSVSLCLHGAGLLVSYLIWGVLQERVMVYEYHTELV